MEELLWDGQSLLVRHWDLTYTQVDLLITSHRHRALVWLQTPPMAKNWSCHLTTRPPPPSYHAHMQKQSTRLPVHQTAEQYTNSDHSKQLLPYRKAKSFDKLFDVSIPSSELTQSPHLHTPHQPPTLTPPTHPMTNGSVTSPHLHTPHQPPALTPPTHPMTNGSVTKDVPTAERRKTTFTIRFDKGAEGAWFHG